MILTHGANSIRYPIYVDGPTIGGRKYKAVKIGSQIWLAENLDWKFSGCAIGHLEGSLSRPSASYYDDDETTYGEYGKNYGLLYNWAAVYDVKDRLPSGWRIPSINDVYTLGAFIGGDAVAGVRMRAKSPKWNGYDKYGFCAVPSGACDPAPGSSGLYLGDGVNCVFWTTSGYESNAAHRYFIRGTEDALLYSVTQKYFTFSVRLVKDV